jgi:hypothetical protein
MVYIPAKRSIFVSDWVIREAVQFFVAEFCAIKMNGDHPPGRGTEIYRQYRLSCHIIP